MSLSSTAAKDGVGHGRPFVVSVEGNIGSGKSTMLKHFQQYSDVELNQEPVDKWCDLNGSNLLQQLYDDSSRWSFQFQSYIQLTRLQILKRKTNKRTRIIERSIQNNRYCFLELAQREGSLTELEIAVLHGWYDWLDSHMCLDLDLIVYLRSSPEVAFERVRKRNRKEESSVPFAYLTSLHNVYEDWLIRCRFGQPQAPVLVIDANQDLDAMMKTYQKFSEEIRGCSGGGAASPDATLAVPPLLVPE